MKLQRKAMGELFTKDQEDIIRAVYEKKAANDDAHKSAKKEAKELEEIQKAASNEQIKDIKRVSEARLAEVESAKKANDNAYADNKISAYDHYQTEIALIKKSTQARIDGLKQQQTVESVVSVSQLTNLEKAYQAILRIESAGGKTLQVNKSSHALGQMQVLPSTLRDPGYGVKPFQPAIDQNITKAMSYNRLLEFVRQNEEGLKKFGQDYFSGLVKHYGSIDKAVNAYGEHTAAYMSKFKQYYGQLSGLTKDSIKLSGEQKDIESEVAKVRLEGAQAEIEATRNYTKEIESRNKSLAELQLRYIELTGTAQEFRAAQIAAQSNTPQRKRVLILQDVKIDYTNRYLYRLRHEK